MTAITKTDISEYGIARRKSDDAHEEFYSFMGNVKPALKSARRKLRSIKNIYVGDIKGIPELREAVAALVEFINAYDRAIVCIVDMQEREATINNVHKSSEID